MIEETQNAETESVEATEDRLVVEVPAEIRAGRSAVGTGYCLYPRQTAELVA